MSLTTHTHPSHGAAHSHDAKSRGAAAQGGDSQGGEAPYVDDGPLAGPVEALVLDIGGDVGALVLYAEEACLGLEVDVTPAGAPRSHHMHTMIRRRRAADREFIAGVYPELVEGTYTVWGVDGLPLGEVDVTGGHVSEFHAADCRSPR